MTTDDSNPNGKESDVAAEERKFVGIREFQRHLGLENHNSVRKAIESKRLNDSVVYVQRGSKTVPRIDLALGVEEWKRNTDPVAAAKNNRFYPKAQTSPPGSDASPSGSDAAPRMSTAPSPGAGVAQLELGAAQEEAGRPAPGTDPTFADSRAKREKFLAEQAELDYLEKVGSLVWARDVERESLEIFKQVRANVLRSNSKIAVLIAAETDPAKVERLLNDSDNKVFDELSRTFADGQAEGTEERAPALS